jgi:hypothetical protein
MEFRTENPYLNPNFYYSTLRYVPGYTHRSLPSSLYPLALPDELSDSYLGTASEKLEPVLNKDLEGIASGVGLPAPNDPLGRFLAGKREFLEKSVQDILGQITERQEIKYDNLKQIDYDWCYATTRLYEIEHWATGLSSNIDRIRTTIHKELTNFQRERRLEEVACWRDTVRLRSELRPPARCVRVEQIADGL